MQLTNYNIFNYAQNCYNLFENETIYLPAKINFLIQKNIKIIMAAGEEIEKIRIQIVSHYGKLDQEHNQYIVPLENIEQTNQEINDLFSIEQELDIKTFKLEDLGNVELTPKQMQAIMFMIEE